MNSAGDHLGGQVEHAVLPGLAALVALAVVAEQLGRPDDGVEDDVVLAHEVVGQRLRVVPPLAPALGLAQPAGPLDRGRQVADHRVEPDVEPLGRFCSVQPSIGTGMPQSMSRVIARGLRSSIRLSENLMTLGRQVPDASRPWRYVLERLGQRRQVEEEVLGLDELRRLAVDLRPRVDQVGRVELVAAVVALVAARVAVPADRAGALDVAVRQGAAGRRRDRAERRLLDHVAVAVHAANSSCTTL